MQPPIPPVTIYATGRCPFCIMARRLLQDKAISFTEIRVDLQPQERQRMRERAAGAHTVPQIFIGDTHVGGCDELYALERAGRLDALLQAAAH